MWVCGDTWNRRSPPRYNKIHFSLYNTLGWPLGRDSGPGFALGRVMARGLPKCGLKAHTHWADFPSADCNSRAIPVGRFQRVQNIKLV